MDFSAKNLKIFLPAAAIALLAWGLCCWLFYAPVHTSLMEKFRQEGKTLRQESLQNQREAVQANGLSTYPAIMDIVQSIDQKIEDIPFLERRKAFLSHTLGFENAGPLLQNQVIDELIPWHETILVSLMDKQGNLLAQNDSGIQEYYGIFHPNNGQTAGAAESLPDDSPVSKEDGDRVSLQNIEGQIFIHAVRHIWSPTLTAEGETINEVMGKIDLIAISPIQLPAMPEAKSKAHQRFTLYALLALPAFLALAFAGAWSVSRWKEAQTAPKTPNTTPKPEAKSPVKEPKDSTSGKPASTQGVKRGPVAPPPNRTGPPPVPPTRPSQAPNPANPTSNPAPAQNQDGPDEDEDPTVLFDPNPSTGKPLGGQPLNTPPHKPGSPHKNKTGGPKPISTEYSQVEPSRPAPNRADEDHAAPPSPTELGKSWEAEDHSPSHPSRGSDRFGPGQEKVAESGLPPKPKGWAPPEGWAFTPPSSDTAAGQPSHPSDHSGEAVDPDATNVYTPPMARHRSETNSTRDSNGTNPTSHTEDDETRFSMISLEIGDRVDESYDILEIIGKGGAGIVYKVQDPVMNRFFAIKVLSNKKLIKRFINEANVGIDLNHENIVKVYPLRKDKHHGFYYLVMDFIDGCNLKKWFREKPGITFREILHILEKVCAGLQYAHDKGTWHRDIKPENIMISQVPAEEYPRVLLVDFGLSKLKLKEGEEGEEGDFTRYGGVGTPKYMPPEQHNGRPTFKADIYSVGYVSFLMFSGGELPEEPGMTNINEVNPIVPQEVGEVLNVAMNYYPSKRHESISQFYEELRDAMIDSDLDIDSSVIMADEEFNVEDPTE